MSTKPVLESAQSALEALILAPIRTIERARGWRRLGLLGLYGLIVLGLLAFLWRRSQLARLPDVGETFGAAASRLGRVPDDRNAFIPYRQAAHRVRLMTDAEGDSFSDANLNWSRSDATLRRWVADNDQAISLMCAGTERPDAFLDASGPATGSLTAANNSEVVIRLSWVGNAALFKAGRLRSEGDPSGAWALLRTVVRVSRDMERAFPTGWCRTTAIMLVQYASQPVADWSNDPAVGTPLLRRALDDLGALEVLTPPISRFYRNEYQTADEAFLQLSLSNVLHDQRNSGLVSSGLFSFAPALEVYFRGEPEWSRRVLRLLAANDLAWCDRPVSERPGFAVPRLRIYDHDPAASASARALSPQELARWTDSSLIAPALKWRLGEVDSMEKNDRWSLGRLQETVAVALFTRENSRPPATPAEALRRYLPMKGDTPDRDEAEPF